MTFEVSVAGYYDCEKQRIPETIEAPSIDDAIKQLEAYDICYADGEEKCHRYVINLGQEKHWIIVYNDYIE